MENQARDRSRNNPSQEHPEPEEAIDKTQDGIREQIRDVASHRIGIWRKAPADMRVQHPLKQPDNTVALEMRRMRIARAVAVLVVRAMDGAPFQDWSLSRHRTG